MVIDSRGSEAAAAAAVASRGPQKTFTDNLYSTFSSPLAWILVLALIITWSCVFVIMLDLADYKTVSGEQRKSPRVGVIQASISEDLTVLSFRMQRFVVKKCGIKNDPHSLLMLCSSDRKKMKDFPSLLFSRRETCCINLQNAIFCRWVNISVFFPFLERCSFLFFLTPFHLLFLFLNYNNTIILLEPPD